MNKKTEKRPGAKILESLFESPKTFEELLKDKKISVSRRTLATEVVALKDKGYIRKQSDSRKSRYELNPLLLDRTSLYPSITAALVYKAMEMQYYEQVKRPFSILKQKFKLQLPTMQFEPPISIQDSEKFKEEFFATIDSAVKDLKKDIGGIILDLLVVQTESDTQTLKIIDEFIHFLYYGFIKNNEGLKESIKKTNNELRGILSRPYHELESELVEFIKAEAKFIYPLEQAIKELENENSPMVPFAREALKRYYESKKDVYNEMGFPFNVIYSNISNKSKNLEHAQKNIKTDRFERVGKGKPTES